MRIAVTGATGYTGGHVLRALAEERDWTGMVDGGVPAPELLALASYVVEGRVASASGDTAAAVRAFERAVEIEDALPYMEPPYWYYPVRQSLGAALLADGRAEEAEAEAEQTAGASSIPDTELKGGVGGGGGPLIQPIVETSRWSIATSSLSCPSTIVTWAAKRIGRPVKWTADRSESFLTDTHGRDHITHIELALDAAMVDLDRAIELDPEMVERVKGRWEELGLDKNFCG